MLDQTPENLPKNRRGLLCSSSHPNDSVKAPKEEHTALYIAAVCTQLEASER